jgi:hypothetical protein
MSPNGATWISSAMFNCTPANSTIIAYNSGTWNPAPYGMDIGIYSSKRSAQQQQGFPFNCNGFDETESGIPSATFSAGILTVGTWDLQDTLVVGLIGTTTFAFMCGVPCTYTIPTYLLVNDGTLFVQVFITDGSYGCQAFPIDATEICDVTNGGWLDWNSPQKFLCYSLKEQIFIGVGFTAGCLFLVLLIIASLFMMYKCWLIRYRIDIATIPTQGSGDSVQQFNMLFLVMLLCFTMSSAQCTTNSIAVTPVNVCSSNSSGIETCYTQIDILSTLSAVGASTCGRLLDSNGNLIGNFNLTYISSGIFAFTSPAYYTSGWTPTAISNKHCPGAGKCSSSHNCPALPWNCTTLGLSGVACQWPNNPTCQASCGCAGCGCIICSSACLFGTYSFIPTGPVYQVFTITSVSVSPVVKFCVTLGAISSCQTLELNQQPQTLLNYFSANVVGSYLTTQALFNNWKLIVGNGLAYLAPAADAGNPTFGTVGDIQTSDPSLLGTPSTTAYVYPSTILQPSATQTALVWNFPGNGIGSLVNYIANRLPFIYGQYALSFDGQTIFGMSIGQATPVEVSFTTSQPVTISFRETIVCPQIQGTASLSGFFSSPLGFTINMVLRSSCSAGAVTVSYTDSSSWSCETDTLSLNGTYSQYLIYCTSTTPHVSGSITLAGQDSSIVVPFSGALKNPPQLTQQQVNQLFGNGTDIPTDFSFSNWWNSLQGPALTAAKILGSIVFGIVLIAVVVGILVALVMLTKAGYNLYSKPVIYKPVGAIDYYD